MINIKFKSVKLTKDIEHNNVSIMFSDNENNKYCCNLIVGNPYIDETSLVVNAINTRAIEARKRNSANLLKS